MYVAASFVGFLLLGTVYFNQNSSEIIKNDVVIQNDATKPTVDSDNVTNRTAVAVVSKTNQGRSIKNSILKQNRILLVLIQIKIRSKFQSTISKRNTISDNYSELNYKVTDKTDMFQQKT
jgi:hypothetical protein